MKYLILLFCILLLNTSSNPSKQRIQHAIKQGKTYLIQQANDDHLTLACQSTDPQSPCPLALKHSSSPLVLFFLTSALDKEINKHLKEIISEKLRQSESNKMWGYAPFVPKDSDDTAFALETIHALNKRTVNTQSLEAFYIPTYHSYTTFLSKSKQHQHPTTLISQKNNEGIHTDVNANINVLFLLNHQKNKIDTRLLTKTQGKDGSWQGYFYPSPYYTNYLAMRVLCPSKPRSRTVKRALNYIKNTQHLDGSWGTKEGNTYETALALNTLAVCHKLSQKNVPQAIHYLLSQQQASGFWSSDQQIIWHFRYLDIPLIEWQALDTYAVITSSLAVQALQAYSMTT